MDLNWHLSVLRCCGHASVLVPWPLAAHALPAGRCPVSTPKCRSVSASPLRGDPRPSLDCASVGSPHQAALVAVTGACPFGVHSSSPFRFQGKFLAFYQYAKSFNSDDFDYEELKNGDYVFMRWKVSSGDPVGRCLQCTPHLLSPLAHHLQGAGCRCAPVLPAAVVALLSSQQVNSWPGAHTAVAASPPSPVSPAAGRPPLSLQVRPSQVPS